MPDPGLISYVLSAHPRMSELVQKGVATEGSGGGSELQPISEKEQGLRWTGRAERPSQGPLCVWRPRDGAPGAPGIRELPREGWVHCRAEAKALHSKGGLGAMRKALCALRSTGVAFKLQGLAALLPAHPPASLPYLPCLPSRLPSCPPDPPGVPFVAGWCDMV